MNKLWIEQERTMLEFDEDLLSQLKRNRAATKQLLATLTESQHQKSTLHKLLAEANKSIQKNQGWRQKFEDQLLKNERLEHRYLSLIEEYDHLRANYEEMVDKKYPQQLEQLGRQLAKAKKQAEEQQLQKERTQSFISQIQNDNCRNEASFIQTIKVLRSKHQAQMSQNIALKKDNQQLKDSYRFEKESNAIKFGQIQALREQLRKSREAANRLEVQSGARMHEAQTILEQFNKENSKLKTQLVKRQSKVQSLESTIRRMTVELSEARAQVKGCLAKIGFLQGQTHRLSDNLQGRNFQLKKFRQEHSDLRSMVQTMQAQEDELKRVNNMLQGNLRVCDFDKLKEAERMEQILSLRHQVQKKFKSEQLLFSELLSQGKVLTNSDR